MVHRPLVQESPPEHGMAGCGALRFRNMATTEGVGGDPARPGSFARLWRTLRQLFHELVGAVFAVLALAWVQSAIRAWTRDGARWLVAMAFFVAAVMAVFSFTSFRRSRRV